MDEVIKVLLVDDDALVRSGLSLMLGGSTDIEVAAEAANGAEAIDILRECAIDVVLMDIRMPVLDGLEATQQILTGKATDPKVIILTTFDADDDVVRALAAGATGFLLKDTPPGQIVSAIKTVAGGDPILSPAVTSKLMRQVAGSGLSGGDEVSAKVARLTERETDVAKAIGRGASNSQIAAELYMSVATVKAHVSRILEKLDAVNRVQVAIMMHDAGLL